MEGLLSDGADSVPPTGERERGEPGRIHAAAPVLPERAQRDVPRPLTRQRQSRRQKSRTSPSLNRRASSRMTWHFSREIYMPFWIALSL